MPILSWWRAFRRRREFEQAMDEEMRFHLEARAADLVRSGLSARDAARQARLEFGAGERYKEECREARGLRLLDEARADLRYAGRRLQRSPGASAVAIVILGLAIGANVALFTFIDNYALRPLPIRAADRYVDLLESDGDGHRSSLWTRDEIAALTAAASPAFEGLYGSNFFEAPLLVPARRLLRGQAVSPSFFPLLGARLALGRPFTAEEEGRTDEAVAVLSHTGWKRLGADPGVLRQKLRLGGTWFTVIGVTVPEFRGVEPYTPELWIPLAAHAAVAGRSATLRYDLAGLLRPGISPERAAGLGSGVIAGFERKADPARGAPRLLVERRTSFLHADERGPLAWIGGLLLAAFGLVLLIACANLASLHVAGASARHREIATRLALGASRARVVRQLLTESLLLAALGAALGWALAVGGVNALQTRLLSIVIEAGVSVAPVELQGRVLLFAAFLGVVAGLAFGLLPALEATSPDLASAGRRDGLALGGRIRPQRLGGVLVTLQVAASLVLLVLASVCLRNTQAAARLDPGYDFARLVALGHPHPTADTVARLRQDPRVLSATAVGHTPLGGQPPRHSMVADGVSRALRFNYVDEAYFETLGLRLAEGRGFQKDEVEPAAPVVIVSAATARAVWPEGGALGRTLEVVDQGGPSRGRYEVIGVAPDVVSGVFFEGRDPSAVYFPAAAGSAAIQEILVRPRGETSAAIEGLRGLCSEIDPTVLCEPKTLREVASLWRFPFLAASLVASGLGSLAMVLTAVGLYGVVAFAALQRLRELGVRMALGATPAGVVRVLLGRAARNVAWGLGLGLPIGILLSVAAARLFRLDGFDPLTLLGVPALLAGVALTAALVPALRATAVDPMVSLRAD